MTTINQFSDLPGTEAIRALANEMFPDLTEGVYGVPETDIPVDDVPEVNSSDLTQGYGTSVPVSEAGGAGGFSESVPGLNVPDGGQFYTGSVPEVNSSYYENANQTSIPGYTGSLSESDTASSQYYGSSTPGMENPEFDWEHPFAYGGSSQDSYFSVIDEASAPEASFSKDVGDVPYVSNQGSTSYAPVVLSQNQAKEQGKKIDAPTSLGGDKTDKADNRKENNSSRNDSIRIGSKTLSQIRNDFPILSEEINGHSLVWLDNGATTQRLKAVIDRLSYYYEHENSNVHRGAHTLAARSTDAYEDARDTVRKFIGASASEEIVFVRGTTEAINLVANAYVKPILQPGDEIIVSILEHHANIVPWQLIAQATGAVIKVIPCDETGQLILHEYEKLFTKRTKFVAVTHVSNVLGTVTPVEELVAIAHRHGVRILIDGAQSVAHIPVNVSALDTDFFVFSGHKIFAPTGIGVVYGKKELLEAAQPYHGGGNMIADVTFERTIYNPIPNKFEAGTGSIADAVGLGAALKYLTDIGMPCVYRWEHELLQYAMKEMKTVKGLHLIGTALNKSSALSFKLDGYSDEEVGRRLDGYGIAVRTGHHCAQPVLRRFGYESSVRPTIALYNSPDDIDALVKVLRTFA